MWRRPHEAMNPRCQQGTVKDAGGGSKLVCGAFTWHGLGPLVLVNTSLTANRFVALLDDHLQPIMDFMMQGVFQTDRASCHRAQSWFGKHCEQFRRMVWPPRLLDMNPIEHLWDEVERSIRTQDPAPTNSRELWAAIQTIWLSTSPEVFRPLVESMPHRGTALPSTRRGPT